MSFVTKRVVCFSLITITLVLAAWFWLYNRPSQTPVTPEITEQFRSKPCWFDTPVGLTSACGELTVAGNKLAYQLPVVIVSRSTNSPSDTTSTIPLVYLGGGPGAGLGLERHQIDSWFDWYHQQAMVQPLILMDYRSTGLATPQFNCRPFNMAYRRSIIGSARAANEDLFSATKNCVKIWRSRGFVEQDFSNQVQALDVARLMGFLGFKQYSVLGVSFGTQVALELAQLQPKSIHKLVLDSPVNSSKAGVNYWPEKFTKAISGYFNQCIQFDSCVVSQGQMTEYLAKLKAHPLNVEVKRWGEPGVWQVDVTDGLFLNSFYNALYSLEKLQQFGFIKLVLDQQEQEQEQARRPRGLEKDSIAKIVEAHINETLTPNFNYFVYYANQCLENQPYNREYYQRQITQSPWQDYLLFDESRDVCQLFSNQPGIDHRSITVPAVILSGSLDPITPVDDARALAAQQPNVEFMAFSGIGHGVLSRSRCLHGALPAMLQKGFSRRELNQNCDLLQ